MSSIIEIRKDNTDNRTIEISSIIEIRKDNTDIKDIS